MRALTFFSLVLAIVSLIFVNRSFSASLISALDDQIRRWSGCSFRGHRDARSDAFVAVCQRSLPFRPVALGRSGTDARSSARLCLLFSRSQSRSGAPG